MLGIGLPSIILKSPNSPQIQLQSFSIHLQNTFAMPSANQQPQVQQMMADPTSQKNGIVIEQPVRTHSHSDFFDFPPMVTLFHMKC